MMAATFYYPDACTTNETQPLHEAIKDHKTCRLVKFFDDTKLASEVCDLLIQPQEGQRLAANERAFAWQNYNHKIALLSNQLAWAQVLTTIQNTSTSHQKNWMQHV